MTKDDLYQKQPACGLGQQWRDATPLGNGLTGVSLFGGCRRDTWLINRHDLWHGGQEATIPDVSGAVSVMRRLMDEGRHEEACSYMSDRLEEAGYTAHWSDMRVLGQLEFFFACPGVYRGYRRILHMDTGEAEIRYRLGEIAYRRRCFVSRQLDVIVGRLESDRSDNFAVAPGFFQSNEGDLTRRIRERDGANSQYRRSGNALVYSTQNDDGQYFGVALRAISDGAVDVVGHGAAFIDSRGVPNVPHITVDGARDTLVVAAAFSCAADRQAGEEEALRRLETAAGMGYAALLREHTQLHRRLYRAADVRLYQGRTYHSNEELLEAAREDRCPLELAEKLWRFGRYLFISGTHPTGNPFPLYGLWNGGYGQPWSQNVGNENIEMIYWHTAAGGLYSLVPSLIHYYYRQMDKGREAARQLYGCRGIFISCFTSPDMASPFPNSPIILQFVGTAGWLCRHFYEYYLQTGDEALLEKEILPFMLETAAFYEDYATEKDGYLSIYPGVSPENSPLEFQQVKRRTSTGHAMPVTKDATMEIAILKELLTHLLQLSKTHSLPQQRVERWREMLAKCPPYRINADGALAEWIDPRMTDNYFHRHLSHVYPLFPGDEIEGSGDRTLVPAIRRAVELRELGAMTGWSMAHMAAIYARLGEGETAFDTLSMMTKVCLLPNFFTLHNDYTGMGITTENHGDLNFAPVQLDAIVGSVNAIQEMLLFSSAKRLRLLPACPPEWVRGRARLHIPGGVVELQWNLKNGACQATFCAQRTLSMTVELPFGNGERQLSLSAGETVHWDVKHLPKKQIQ